MQIRVLGESRYDHVTSMLTATVIGATVIVLWLSLVYITNRAFARRISAPIEIIQVYGGGGGSPDGEVGSSERVDVAGAEAQTFASNNEMEPGDFEEPSVQKTPSAMLDSMMDATDQVGDLAEEMNTGGAVATGRRGSKIGTGGPAYGFGPGDGGVPAEQRWSIVYNRGQTVDEYARQLDSLGIEVGTIVDGQMYYASDFSAAKPKVRVGSGQGDNRLYFVWQGGERKESDVTLLHKAGVQVAARGAIFHFFPPGMEKTLQQLEVKYKGLNPLEIRVTRFAVIPQGRAYGFQVIDQQALR